MESKRTTIADVLDLQIKHNFDTAKVHDEMFGEGSWAEVEANFAKRHPHLYAKMQEMKARLTEKKKWWQIWK